MVNFIMAFKFERKRCIENTKGCCGNPQQPPNTSSVIYFIS